MVIYHTPAAYNPPRKDVDARWLLKPVRLVRTDRTAVYGRLFAIEGIEETGDIAYKVEQQDGSIEAVMHAELAGASGLRSQKQLDKIADREPRTRRGPVVVPLEDSANILSALRAVTKPNGSAMAQVQREVIVKAGAQHLDREITAEEFHRGYEALLRQKGIEKSPGNIAITDVLPPRRADDLTDDDSDLDLDQADDSFAEEFPHLVEQVDDDYVSDEYTYEPDPDYEPEPEPEPEPVVVKPKRGRKSSK